LEKKYSTEQSDGIYRILWTLLRWCSAPITTWKYSWPVKVCEQVYQTCPDKLLNYSKSLDHVTKHLEIYRNSDAWSGNKWSFIRLAILNFKRPLILINNIGMITREEFTKSKHLKIQPLAMEKKVMHRNVKLYISRELYFKLPLILQAAKLKNLIVT